MTIVINLPLWLKRPACWLLGHDWHFAVQVFPMLPKPLCYQPVKACHRCGLIIPTKESA